MNKYAVVRASWINGCEPNHEPAPYYRFVGTLEQCKNFVIHELAIATAGGDWVYEYTIKEYNND